MKSFILWSAGVKTQDCQRFYSNHAALHKQRVIEAAKQRMTKQAINICSLPRQPERDWLIESARKTKMKNDM